MRYMISLNDWLARDVRDRQNEMRSIGARVDALRGELLGGGFQPGEHYTIVIPLIITESATRCPPNSARTTWTTRYF